MLLRACLILIRKSINSSLVLFWRVLNLSCRPKYTTTIWGKEISAEFHSLEIKMNTTITTMWDALFCMPSPTDQEWIVSYNHWWINTHLHWCKLHWRPMNRPWSNGHPTYQNVSKDNNKEEPRKTRTMMPARANQTKICRKCPKDRETLPWDGFLLHSHLVLHTVSTVNCLVLNGNPILVQNKLIIFEGKRKKLKLSHPCGFTWGLRFHSHLMNKIYHAISNYLQL